MERQKQANQYITGPGEYVILEQSKHWINLLPVVAAALGFVIIAAAVAYAAGRFADIMPPFVTPAAIIGVAAVLSGLALAMLGVGYWVYRQNRVILTNLSIVEIHQNGLFNRKESQVGLGAVQQASGNKRGLLATLLNFGDLIIETAGEQNNLTFTQVPNPHGLANRVMQAQEELDGRAEGLRR